MVDVLYLCAARSQNLLHPGGLQQVQHAFFSAHAGVREHKFCLSFIFKDPAIHPELANIPFPGFLYIFNAIPIC